MLPAAQAGRLHGNFLKRGMRARRALRGSALRSHGKQVGEGGGRWGTGRAGDGAPVKTGARARSGGGSGGKYALSLRNQVLHWGSRRSRLLGGAALRLRTLRDASMRPAQTPGWQRSAPAPGPQRPAASRAAAAAALTWCRAPRPCRGGGGQAGRVAGEVARGRCTAHAGAGVSPHMPRPGGQAATHSRRAPGVAEQRLLQALLVQRVACRRGREGGGVGGWGVGDKGGQGLSCTAGWEAGRHPAHARPGHHPPTPAAHRCARAHR